MKNKTIVALILIGFLLPNFAFLQSQTITPPETLNEAKSMGEKFWGIVKNELGQIIVKIWKEEVWPIWLKMYNWAKKNLWDPYLGPLLGKEIEKRKPVIKEEFQKEKKELKEEAPRLSKSLWERFKELIK